MLRIKFVFLRLYMRPMRTILLMYIGVTVLHRDLGNVYWPGSQVSVLSPCSGVWTLLIFTLTIPTIRWTINLVIIQYLFRFISEYPVSYNLSTDLAVLLYKCMRDSSGVGDSFRGGAVRDIGQQVVSVAQGTPAVLLSEQNVEFANLNRIDTFTIWPIIPYHFFSCITV